MEFEILALPGFKPEHIYAEVEIPVASNQRPPW